MKRIIQLIVHVLLFCATQAFGQNERLDSLLSMIATKYQLVGMSVAIVQDSGVVFSQGYGLRDIERNLPVNEQTKFRIASISKFITAMAVMQLYEQGLFKLEDDVSQYLGFELKNPAFRNQFITFKMLLSHTSSLRDGSGYDRFLSDTYGKNPPPALKQLLIPGGTYYTADMFDASRGPDQKYFQYANINFGILGTLVERISGERFDQYCKKHLFDPLGIAASFNVRDLPDINDLAVLYRKSGSSWVAQFDRYNGVSPPERDLSGYSIGENGVIFSPQGGLRISAIDLAKLMIVHLNGGSYHGMRLLADTTISRMHEVVWRYNGINGDSYYGIFKTYGLGNHTTTDLLPGQQLIGHPGEAYGLISDCYFSKLGKYGIIFITNGGQWGYGQYSGWYNVEEDVFKTCFAQLPNLTSVTSILSAPKAGFQLEQNSPNPFNSATRIRFYLPNSSVVALNVYDVTGRLVAQLLDRFLPAGSHEISFDGAQLCSGVYFYQLRAGHFSAARKLILLR
ncbi:MAG: serine hydrolase [candidate division KSB1 bacterium]|nr:serine hydrolase [candidate division KSB1 bacterium]